MRQNNRNVSSAGVDLVVGQLQKNEFGFQEFSKVVQIESIWVEGLSVKRTKLPHFFTLVSICQLVRVALTIANGR